MSLRVAPRPALCRRLLHGTVPLARIWNRNGPPQLTASAPSHQCYIFLHAPEPPTEFAARKSTPIQRALQLRATRWGGVVNFSWSQDTEARSEEDRVQGTAYTMVGGRLNLTNIALENIDDVEAQILQHMSSPVERAVHQDQGLDFYVCTHGQRDCRCLDLGKPVVSALQDEIARRRLKETLPPINVFECGHVGQHALAANVLLYPHGEWFGLLKPENVPDFLQQVLSVPSRPRKAEEAPLVPEHWRGRMGLSRDEQMSLFQSHVA